MKWICLLCGLLKITSSQCGGSALIWCSCSGRKQLVFSVSIEISSFSVSGHRNRLGIRVGIKLDLISVMRSKLTWFLRAGLKLTCFYCRDRTWLVFRAGVKSASVLCAGRKILGLIYGSKLTWFSAWGSKLTWFWCVGNDLVLVFGSELTWLWYGDRNWSVFCAGIGIDLLFLLGSKMLDRPGARGLGA